MIIRLVDDIPEYGLAAENKRTQEAFFLIPNVELGIWEVYRCDHEKCRGPKKEMNVAELQIFLKRNRLTVYDGDDAVRYYCHQMVQ